MGNLNRLAHDILRSTFHIHPLESLSYFGLAYDFLHKRVTDNPIYQQYKLDDEAEPASYFIDSDHRAMSAWTPEDRQSREMVSVIPVIGAVVKYGSSFSYGTVDFEQMVKMAENNPRVIAHVLHMDTPGGSVYGTLTFAQLIKSLEKPVVGIIDSMCCSAGMEIISASGEIYATHRMDIMGSIGTVVRYANIKPMWEQKGVEFHEIFASKSKEKGKIYRDADEGKYEGLIKELLDPINEDFLQTIQENMPQMANLSEEDREWILSGPTFFAEQGVSYGLIDDIGTFDDAIERAFELGRNRPVTMKV